MRIRANDDIRASLIEIRDLIARALEAENTRDIAALAVGAQATASGLRLYLDDLLHDPFTVYDLKLDEPDLQAARNALGETIVAGEAVGLAVDVPSMLARVQTFRTDAERAIAAIASAFNLGQV